MLLLPVALAVAWARVYVGVHYPLDMAGALLVAGGVTALFHSRAAAAACDALVPLMESAIPTLVLAPVSGIPICRRRVRFVKMIRFT
jgi:undecaprenyl-diphosphatase